MNATMDTHHDYIAEQAKRTLFGQLGSIDEIVTGLRYVRSIVTPGKGSRLDKEPGELFVSFDSVGPSCWVGKGMDHALVGSPRVRLPEFPGRPGQGPRPAGSLRFVCWGLRDVALVMATDPNHIADRWLAIVPMASLRALKVEQPA